MSVSLNEGVLRKVVAELRVAQCLGEEKFPHPRLVSSHYLVEGSLVAAVHHLCYERNVVCLYHCADLSFVYLLSILFLSPYFSG